MKRTNLGTLLGISFALFILLGISNNLFGVTWPSIQNTFSLPLAEGGILLFSANLGYTIASLFSGQLSTRFGTGKLLSFATLLVVLGIFGEAVSPHWWVLVLMGFGVGAGNGLIDSGINIFTAPRISTGMMSWLHASYGVGATIGPILVTSMLKLGTSWRWVYGVVALLQLISFMVVLFSRREWNSSQLQAHDSAAQVNSPKPIETLRLGTTWLYIIIFFLYAGVELAAGQWAYTVYTQSRHVDPLSAGAWVSFYWLSFTISRFLLGWVAHRFNPVQVVRLSCLVAIIGVGLFWWNPINLIGFLGLAILGFSFATIYPSLVTNTPVFLGLEHTPNAIGFNVAATSISGGILPPLAGILASTFGLESIGPFLTLITVAVFILHEITVVMQRNRAGAYPSAGESK